MKLALLSLLALVGHSRGQTTVDCFFCDICEGSSLANPDATVNFNAQVATCNEFYVFACSFIEPDACPTFQAGLSAECCGGAAADAAEVTVPASESTCPDETGCDICPTSTIVDDSEVATIDIDGVNARESATCAEWFTFGCTFAEPDLCPDLQDALADLCCAPADGPAADVNDSSTCPDSTGCDICPEGHLIDEAPATVVTFAEVEERCDEWFLYGCIFAEADICGELQAAMASCCTTEGTAGDAPVADASQEACPDATGCDICPTSTIVDDSALATIEVDGIEAETATCAEWFFFGCGFVEEDVCGDVQAALADQCCGGAAPDSTPEGTGEPMTTDEAMTTAEPGTTAASAADSSSCPDGTGCHICPGGHFNEDAEAEVVTFLEIEERCDEWFVYGCIFAEPDICEDLQAAMADCCTTEGTAGDAPAADASQEACPDSTGCDVCPDSTIVDDSKVATVEIAGVEAESATCAEWFLFGCGFAEADICPDLQAALGDQCCGGTAPDETTAAPDDAETTAAPDDTETTTAAPDDTETTTAAPDDSETTTTDAPPADTSSAAYAGTALAGATIGLLMLT